ncbi:HAD-IIIC family phosphatase [Nocardia otitidiscaviarum]|uniref:HAD-IIIC family phosphatase n=1 Tax=Nocardia otitidiscaviarum TaxID=1823 RepID=UPI0018956B6B|nr:hybrid fatty acyl-AMP ligase/type I polyketide synthase [Nocardia otitidiscaviarum]MBF6240918.1 HAD-IIIC family phosphatase [Nocardia otitidiscaviarum]
MVTTFVDTLFAQVEARPTDLVYRFLDSGDVDGVVRETRYAELGLRVRAIGAALQDSRPRRALLLYPAGPEFAEAFLGCLAAGVVAVPAPLPEWDNRSLRRLRRMVAHAEVDVVLAPRRIAADTAALCAEIPELTGLPWLATDLVAGDEAARWREPDLGADAVAFIQYTSGSTSAPRGVVLTHENLLHNQAALAAGLGHDRAFADSWDGALFASWLPMYHDMGLIAPLLHTVYLGAHSVLMSPLHFLQRPERWLRTISTYRAHTSGGPNFAYELCVRKITPEQLEQLDLSRWRVAFNGSEPVRATTVRRFADTFGPVGFRAKSHHPVYGLAEATLIVTAPDPTATPTLRELVSPGGTRELVGVGRPVPGMSVAIVDPERGTECADGDEGEIWVAGNSVAGGYFRDEQASGEVFGATLPGHSRPFLRTGDLGIVSGGELFITGRRKDLLIVDGRNHYPQDIESTVEAAHAGVRPGCIAAFSVEFAAAGEQPVVVAEVRGEDADELAVIEAAVRGAVATEHGLTLANVMLLRPGTIFKTSSGKIQRAACRAAYASGELLELAAGPLRSPEDELYDYEPPTATAESDAEEAAGPSAEAIRSWLVQEIARQAALDPERIDVRLPLVEFGLGSHDLVELVVELSDFVGRFLDTNMFFDHPTIEGVAAALAPAAPIVADPVAPAAPVSAEPAADDDAIAILSMACRFPGGVDSPEALWRLLDGMGDALTDVPPDRWDIDGLYDPDTTATGKAYTFRGGYVDGVDRFDAAFFGIGPREATVMDPQQRIMLQLAWEAIERSGRDPRTLHGSATGVYLGVYSTGYLADPAPEQLNGQVGTGLSPSVASGRISYTLGLHGPAVTLDTACSSSIVAMHSAMQALRAGECELALAGGATLLMSPTAHIELCKLGVLSPTGRCAPFAADGDGTVWAEGAGLVLLKRLGDARRDGDRVLAVIRGSAVNQDGRSQGLSAPNGAAQEQVLRSALRVSGLAPEDVDYVEAHGTGTALGDPIEARALARVFGPGRDPARPLGIGSLKSNVGHTQAAAGVGSVMKLVLALQHERIPATLHASVPSPQVDWERSGIAVAAEPLPWRRGDRPRRAGVSAFGLSGTNAHLVLEEAPLALVEPQVEAARAVVGGTAARTSVGAGPQMGAGTDTASTDTAVTAAARAAADSAADSDDAATDAGSADAAGAGAEFGTAVTAGTVAASDTAGAGAGAGDKVVLLPISARSPASLHGQAERLLEMVAADPGLRPGPVARSLALHRSRFERRAVVVAGDRDEMVGGLRELVDGRSSPRVVRGAGTVLTNAKTAFVFPGQGTQWVGMARDLLDSTPEFRAEFERCDKTFGALTGWSLVDRLTGMTAADLTDFPVVQPLLFATMAGLAATWRAAGVTPDAVVGHSQGEIAAAYCAGVIELDDAARIVVARSRLMQTVPEPGAMAIVRLPEAELTPRLERADGRVSVAAVNVPDATVVAGAQADVERLVAELDRDGVSAQLRAAGRGYGGHCRLIEAIRGPLSAELADLIAEAPATQWYSTVTGEPVNDEIGPDYWYRNARETVRFAATVERMIADGFRYFVELGVHPSLTAAVRTVSEGLAREVVAVGSLVRDQDGPSCLARARAELWVAGHELDWTALVPESGRVDLPTYAFDERRFWTERVHRDTTALGLEDSAHPILVAVVPQPDSDGVLLTGRVSRRLQPWVADHAGPTAVLLPGAALVEMAVRAGDEVGSPIVRELVLRAPLLIPEQGAVGVQTVVGGAGADGLRTVRVYSRDESDPDAQWTLNADGTLCQESDTSLPQTNTGASAPHTPLPRAQTSVNTSHLPPQAETTAPPAPGSAWPPENALRIDIDALYDALIARGHHYGPAFRALRSAWRHGDEIVADVELPESVHADAASYGIHPALLDAALHATILFSDGDDHALLPFVWTDVQLWATGAAALRVRLARTGADTVTLTATDRTGRPVVSVGGVLSRPVAAAQWDAATLSTAYRRLFRMEWTHLEPPAPRRTPTLGDWEDTATPTADVLVLPVPRGTAPEQVHAAAQRVLTALRTFLGDSRFEHSTLVVRTHGAVPVTTVSTSTVPGRLVSAATREVDAGGPSLHGAAVPGATIPSAAPSAGATPPPHRAAHGTTNPSRPARSGARPLPETTVSGANGAAEDGGAHMPAVGRSPIQVPDPAGAVVWGLVRSAQSENPGRIVLLDTDESEADIGALLAAGEPQVAVRGGVALRPRLVRLPEGGALERVRIGDGAVLITGAPGRLGSALARHLVEAYGVRDLVLVSRRGIDGPGGRALCADLEGRGVRVRFAACDITDRPALADLLGGLPLAGVVHAATVLDDGTIGSLTSGQLDRVLRPKVDAAHHLHELTRDRELRFFVLFSAAGGLFGTPGQANYAAANAYLDALALYRRSRGLPAQSLAWGAWEVEKYDHYARADVQRIERAGIRTFSVAQGMACFDAALAVGDPLLVPLLLDTRVLRRSPSAPPLLRGLVYRAPQRAVADHATVEAAAGAHLADELRTRPRPEAVTRAVTALAEWTGQVLGHTGTESVATDEPFQSLGLDSLMAIELRNKVRDHTGVSVPLGTILAERTLTDLADHLVDEITRTTAGSDIAASDPTGNPDADQPAIPEVEVLPVTRDMMRLLRTEQLGIPSAAQTGGVAVRLPALVTPERLEQAVARLARRHAALRTAIRPGEEYGRRLEIHREPGQLTGWRALDRLDDTVIAAAFRELMARPFDLEAGPLWRFELLTAESARPVLLFGAHHAMSDVQSMLLVAGELTADLSGAPLGDAVTNRDMHQLIAAQPHRRDRDDTAADCWREAFTGAERLELTLANPRPAQRSYGAGTIALDLPDGLHERVADRARDLGLTPAAVFLAALTVLLARRQHVERFAIAVPVDTRMHADATDAVGYFGVPVPFPAAVAAGEPVGEVLRRTGACLRDLLAPGAGLADALAALARAGLHRDNAPLIEVYFNYLRANSAVATAEVVPVSTGFSDLDLMVAVLPDTGQVWFTYNTDIIDERTCAAFGADYLDTVAAAIGDPDAAAVPGTAAREAAAQTHETAPPAAPSTHRMTRPQPDTAAQPASSGTRPESDSRRAPQSLRVAVSATFALGRLPELLTAAAADTAPVTVVEAPYHQVLSSLRDPSGVFAPGATQLGIVLLRGSDLERFGAISDELLAELAADLPAAVREVAERTHRPMLVGILPSARAEQRFLDWERLVAERLRALPGVAVLEADAWTRHHPVDEPFDDRAEVLAHLPFSLEFQAAVALTLAATVDAVTEPAPKVIAVDGDDTLWSGVVGEIGSTAVVFDGARLILAQRLAEWRAAGTLLVLLTNNDEDVVRAVLDRADSPLRADDFAVVSAGWEPKPERLEQVARTLRLGLDSFCYLDDNPVEVARMRARLPEVLAVTCPPADELEAFLTRLWPLVPVPATAEDRARADFYHRERERDTAQAAMEFADFLNSLELEVTVEPLTEATVERAAQLVRRTTQFTLAAVTADDLESWRSDGEVWTATARDRFGDYGLISVLALRSDSDALWIRGWQLSCRALGRGIEERLLSWVADRAEALGHTAVRLVVERTPRNEPARRLAVRLLGGTPDERRLEVRATPERLRRFRSWDVRPDETEATGERN